LERWKGGVEARIQKPRNLVYPTGSDHLPDASLDSIVQEGSRKRQSELDRREWLDPERPLGDPRGERAAGGYRHLECTQGPLAVPRIQASRGRRVSLLELAPQSRQALALEPPIELAPHRLIPSG
jgi:hypothetical protein